MEKESICPNCGVMMREEITAMGITIVRCPLCGDWKEVSE